MNVSMGGGGLKREAAFSRRRGFTPVANDSNLADQMQRSMGPSSDPPQVDQGGLRPGCVIAHGRPQYTVQPVRSQGLH